MMNKRIFKLRCPHCGHYMLYSPNIDFNKKDAILKLKNKRKKCVYCGKSFLITKAIRKTDD